MQFARELFIAVFISFATFAIEPLPVMGQPQTPAKLHKAGIGQTLVCFINMADDLSKRMVYSSQSQGLRPINIFLTSLSFQLNDYCVLTAELPAGSIVPLHSHSDRESFYILSGEIGFYNGDSWRILRRGDFVDVLNNIKHAWRNASESSTSLLIVTTVRMGVFLRQVSSSVGTEPENQLASKQKEQFFTLAQDYGYWLGSPEDNKAIGLSTDWHRTADQSPMS